MTDKKAKVVIGIEVDANGVKSGMNEVASSATGMAEKVKRAGTEAGAAVGGIGNGASKSSDKVEAATRNMIGSIQRATAAMEAGSKTGSKYYETLAGQRGISTDALRPYLDQLDKVSQSQVKTGMSAAAMSNAMRNVPAQFTDIVTSLQGGQKPMTVLLQQGGQLKDMFGGAGNAAKALSRYIVGLINPFTLAAAGVAALGAAYYYGSEQSKRLNTALIVSGNLAGTTGEKLNAIAESVGKATGKYSEAREAVASLAEAGTFSASAIGRLSGAIVAGSNLTGKSVQEMVADFEKINKEPLKAVDELNSKYNFLTVGIRNAIKALEDQGKTAQAAALASDSYADAVTSRDKQVVENLGSIEKGWKDISEATKFAMNLALSVGRVTDPAQDLLIEKSKLNSLNQSKAGIRGTSLFIGGLNDDIAAQEKLIASIEKGIATKESDAAATGRQAAAQKKLKEQSENLEKYISNDKHLTKSKALEEEAKAFEKATEGYAKGSKEYQLAAEANAQANKKINDQFKDKSSAPHIAKEATAYDTLVKSIHEKVAASQLELMGYSQLSEAQKETIKLNELVAIAKKKGTALSIDEAKAQLDILATNDHLIGSRKQAAEASAALHEDRQKSYQSAIEEAIKNEELAATFGMTKSAIEQLEIARMSERLEQRKSLDLSEDEVAQLERLIEAKKRSAAASSSLEQMDAAKKASEVMNAEWKKSVEQYDDIFRKGFADMVNNGKGAWKSFTTSLVTTFKTSVADQIYKMFAQPFVVKMVGSMIGMFSGGAASDAVGAVGAASAGKSMFGEGATLLSAGSTLWTGFKTAASAGGAVAGMGSMLSSGGSAVGLTSVSQFGSGMTSGAGAFLGQGPTVAGSATGTGALASGAGSVGVSAASWIPVVGWIAAGMATAQNLRKQGWDSGNMGGLSNTGNLLGSGSLGVDSLLRGLGMSSTLANLLSGQSTIARIFGRKAPELRGFGIEGNIGTSGLAGNTYQNIVEKGGWFRSDKNYTKTGAIEAGTQAMFDESTKAIIAASKGFGAALGVDASVIDGYSKQIKLAFSSDEKANQEQVTKLFSGIADELSVRLVPSLASMSKTGETSSQTLQRLSGDLTATNLAMKALGLATYAVSIDGAKGAESLITLFGSLQDLQTASSSYYDNFYSDAEKLKLSTSLVADAFAAAGKTMPATREALRAMVEAAKSAGDESSYASLIKLSSAFASVVAATDTTTAALQAKAKAEANANERAGLSKELMQQLNDVAGLRKLELDAIDASNRGLKQQIYDLQDKQKAEELAAASAQKLADSWQSITDSMVSEITRIKGLIGGDSAQSYAGAQSQFAITTAQARAGDQDAAKLLPQLSQTMLALAEQNAASAFDLLRIRELTAASLATTATSYQKYGVKLQSFAVGTDYVSHDQIAQIHEGERITPAAYNRSDATNADLVEEIKMLNEKVAQLIAINARTEEHTRGSADSLDRVANGGAVLLVQVEAP